MEGGVQQMGGSGLGGGESGCAGGKLGHESYLDHTKR